MNAERRAEQDVCLRMARRALRHNEIACWFCLLEWAMLGGGAE